MFFVDVISLKNTFFLMFFFSVFWSLPLMTRLPFSSTVKRKSGKD